MRVLRYIGGIPNFGQNLPAPKSTTNWFSTNLIQTPRLLSETDVPTHVYGLKHEQPFITSVAPRTTHSAGRFISRSTASRHDKNAAAAATECCPATSPYYPSTIRHRARRRKVQANEHSQNADANIVFWQHHPCTTTTTISAQICLHL